MGPLRPAEAAERVSSDLRCPHCGGTLLPDTLEEADLVCLLCSRRFNLVERHLEPAQLAFEALPDVGDRRRAKPRPAATDGFMQFHR